MHYREDKGRTHLKASKEISREKKPDHKTREVILRLIYMS